MTLTMLSVYVCKLRPLLFPCVSVPTHTVYVNCQSVSQSSTLEVASFVQPWISIHPSICSTRQRHPTDPRWLTKSFTKRHTVGD